MYIRTQYNYSAYIGKIVITIECTIKLYVSKYMLYNI